MDDPFGDLRKKLDGKPPAWHPPENKRDPIYRRYDQMVFTVLEQLKDAVFAPLQVDRKMYRSHFFVRWSSFPFEEWAISLEFRNPTYMGRQWEDHVTVNLTLTGPSWDPAPTCFWCRRCYGGRGMEMALDLSTEALIEALRKLYE